VAWGDDLSAEQAAYASHAADRLRLVAGPGTGKTRVMTRRVAYLIEEENVEPGSILALTFSRAAARELRERLESLLGEEIGDRPAVSTLHAFALRQLLRNRGAPNLPRPIRIADDYDERHVIQEELKELTGLRVRQVRREFANLSSDWETLAADEDEWERQFPNPRFLAAWRQQRSVYGYTLRAELVYSVKKALDEDPEFELERNFSNIVVDEYQDLNRCEIEVTRQVVGDGRRLFVAGDDDQSIYGFRNAFPLGLREFNASYPGAEEGELEECHRCDREILRLALAVAEQDLQRIPKNLRPRGDAGDGTVAAYRFRNITDEAHGIAELCAELRDQHDVELRRVLILLRSDPQRVYSDPIREALAGVGIEVEIPTDPFAILDEPDLRALTCILRLLREPSDGLAWRELLELRANGIGAGTLFAAYKLAAERRQRYHETLTLIADEPDVLESRLRNRLAEEIREIENLLDQLQPLFEQDASPALAQLLDALGIDSDDGREAVTELLESVVSDEDEPSLSDMEKALHGSRSAMEGVTEEPEADRVRIMTMHSAKGLTADAVIVAACDDELIPGTPEDERELDEQRRLLYVSLTRARHYLYVTYAVRRMGRQSHMLGLSEARTFTQFLRDYLTPDDLWPE
jgi:DNA helicase-2/ATP-dependent DNA helicase PcrA